MTCTKKKTEKKVMAKRRKMTIAATVLLAGAIAIGTASYHAFRKPRPKSDRPEDIAKFVASSGFNRLSAAERQAYLRKLRPDPAQGQTQSRRPRMQNMSGEERSAFMANMMRLFEQERSRRLKNISLFRRRRKRTPFWMPSSQKWSSAAPNLKNCAGSGMPNGRNARRKIRTDRLSPIRVRAPPKRNAPAA